MTHKQKLILFFCASAIFGLYLLLGPKKESQIDFTARMFERNNGLPGASLKKIIYANQNLRSRKATEADVVLLEEFSRSPHLQFRVSSELALTYLKGTAYQGRAHAILTRLAEDPDPGTRLIAIRSLASFSKSEALAFVARNQNSSDPYIVRKIAVVKEHVENIR